ncbi:hypothetical protein Tco_0753999 [Tanacetum coccineum]
MYLYICPAIGFTCADTMDDMNIPADDVPPEQFPAIAPPIRTDDQILPLHNWVPVGKSNCVLDVLKPQKSPIFKIVVAILKNTNFFRAFTTSSMIPAIYIQQFWDTMRYDSTTGIYNYQLDEQWFNLHKYILRDALQITPINDNDPFMAPPSSDTVIEYVNTLGYPCTLKNVSAIHPVLLILWGVIHRSNIDYAERIWEEFVQSIHTFLTDKKSLTTTTRGKKKSTPLLILSIRFTKFIIHYLKTKHNIHPRTNSPLHYSHEDHVLGTLRSVGKDGREIFGMPIPDALLTDAIKRAPYYGEYMEHVTKYQQYLDEERGKATKKTKPSAPKATKVTKPAGDEAPKHTSSQPPISTPALTESSKKDQGKKRKLVKETFDAPSPAKRSKAGKVTKKSMPNSPLRLVDEFVDEGVPHKESAYDDEEANLQRALDLSLKDRGECTQGPARLVVFREPDSGRFQPLPEVQGKGKEKVIDEQAAHDLLTLQTPKKKSPSDQFIFQRRTPMSTEPSGNAESPSLDAELALTNSEIESDEEVPPVNPEKDASYKELTEINTEVQDEG